MAANACISDFGRLELGHTYNFEREFDYEAVSRFMDRHFPSAIAIVVVYLVALHSGQRYMRFRPALRLRGALVFWNVALAAFSLFAFWRVSAEMTRAYRRHGFHDSICSLRSVQHANVMVIWCAIFAASKVLELGDTLFVVCRKAPLLFLHWFHHVATLLFVWYNVTLVNSMGRWFMVNNLFVHVIMYTYYALKVLGLRVPASFSMAITGLQLLQMFAGIGVSIYAFRMKAKGVLCCTDDRLIACAWAMYLLYFLLFLNFFAKSYLGHGARADRKKAG